MIRLKQALKSAIHYGHFHMTAQYYEENGTIPHAVISATVDGNSPIKAWREYLGFSPAEIAARLDMSQAEFAEIETAVKLRQTILKKVAHALGLTVAQLDF